MCLLFIDKFNAQQGKGKSTPSKAGDNLVYIYDLNGNLQNTLYIPKKNIMSNDNKGSLPELEGLDFYDNGKILYGFTLHWKNKNLKTNKYKITNKDISIYTNK